MPQQLSSACPTSTTSNMPTELHHVAYTVVFSPGCWVPTSHDSQMSRNLADHPTGRAGRFRWVQEVASRWHSWYSLGTIPWSTSDQSQLPKVNSSDPKGQVLAASHPVCLCCNYLQYERSPDQQDLSGHYDSMCWSILSAIAQQVAHLPRSISAPDLDWNK